jgi:predicted aconitase
MALDTAVRLTAEEEGMLLGERGPMAARAMRNVVRFAEALGAGELCEVTMSTVYAGAHPYLEVCGVEDPAGNFAVMNMGLDPREISGGDGRAAPTLGAFSPHCRCQTCVEPFDADLCDEMGVPQGLWRKNEDYVAYVARAGAVRAATCAPYLTGWVPLRGTHFVSTES